MAGTTNQQADARHVRVVAFVDARLRGLSKRDAAIVAGYSPVTASSAGTRMAKSADVLAEIKRRGAALAAASHAADPAQDADPESEPELSTALLNDPVMQPGKVKWKDGMSFLLAVVNSPAVDVKVRVDAAYRHERVKAGFGKPTQQPGLFDTPHAPGAGDASGATHGVGAPSAASWGGLLQ